MLPIQARHDDGPDALEMAVAMARSVKAHVPFEFYSIGKLVGARMGGVF